MRDKRVPIIILYYVSDKKTAITPPIFNYPALFLLTLRLGLGGNPININSFFRRAELNSLIGGSKNSQHLCNNGVAMDLDSDNNKEIFDYIHDNLVFDQLIWEYGDNDNPAWVHVSYHKDNNRQQSLRCVNGNYYST